MPHKYTTHVCETENLKCGRCRATIAIGDEFAVVVGRSDPWKENCLSCTDTRLEAGEEIIVDSTQGKAKAGKQRA